MEELSRVYPDRRKHPRRVVNIPVSVQLTTSPDTVPIDNTGAFISDISYGGACVCLTVVTMTRQEDLAKMFTRRRTCHVFCKFPGSSHTSCLFGEIIWVAPRGTAKGAEMQFGVSLERSAPEALRSLEAFLQGTAGECRQGQKDPSTKNQSLWCMRKNA